MSEMHAGLAEIVEDRASFTTDRVKNLRTGLQFTAEIEPVDPIIAQAELGEDVREVVVLHVTSDFEAAEILTQDRVTLSLFGKRPETYKIVKRRDNAANVQTDFWAVQVAAGKDS